MDRLFGKPKALKEIKIENVSGLYVTIDIHVWKDQGKKVAMLAPEQALAVPIKTGTVQVSYVILVQPLCIRVLSTIPVYAPLFKIFGTCTCSRGSIPRRSHTALTYLEVICKYPSKKEDPAICFEFEATKSHSMVVHPEVILLDGNTINRTPTQAGQLCVMLAVVDRVVSSQQNPYKPRQPGRV